jgi:hypothetical protein
LDIDSRTSALEKTTKMPVTRERLLRVAIADGSHRYEPLLSNPERSYQVDWNDVKQLLDHYDRFDLKMLPVSSNPRSLSEAYTHALQVCSNVALGRHIFQSLNGRLGLASKVENGDLLTILHGCTTPVLLRPHLTGTYSYDGTCYFEDAMYGEAVTWEDEDADEFVLD